VLALALNPGNSQEVYAGCSYGAYKSTNGGSNWAASSVGMDNLYIRALAVDPANASTVYAGTYFSDPYEAKVYKSTNSGASWMEIQTRCGDGVLAIAVDPKNSRKVCVAYGGVFYSSDGGTQWAFVEDQNPPFVGALVIDPVSSTVYAGTSDGVKVLTIETRPR
jgi:photosystem II stability/assembly factor-like uncharacterized protein